jgi:hypothetical protein
MFFNFLGAGATAGILLSLMDGVINANPLARRLLQPYEPIARTSVNAVVGIAVDFALGFALAAIFMIVYRGLPGRAAWIKGLSFGLLVWFLRFGMATASDWVMFRLPHATLLYGLVTGLVEMIILGLVLGVALHRHD